MTTCVARSTSAFSAFTSSITTMLASAFSAGKALLLALLTLGSAHALALSVNVSVSPGTISPGGTAYVTWSSSGASYCTYLGYALPGVNGSLPVSPAATKSYTVYCYNTVGFGSSDSATLYVQQPPPPPVPSVSAWISPGSVYTGEAATLYWGSSDASYCNYGNTSGAVTVGPYSSAGTQWFTVVCYGPGGSGSSSASLAVYNYPAPSVSLNVSPSSITAGGQATWAWASSNASYCQLGGGGAIATSGSQSFTYPNAGTYSATLTCYGPGGSGIQTKSITVVPLENDPVDVSLTLSDNEITLGEPVFITVNRFIPQNQTGGPFYCGIAGNWDTAPQVYDVPAIIGTPMPISVGNPGQYTYTYTCGWGTGPSNSYGSDTDSVILTVSAPPPPPPPPPTVDLTVTPSSGQISLAQSAQLSLATTNTASCSFSGAFGAGPYPVANGAALTVTPPAATEYTYTATCQNSVGQTATDTVYLNVTAEPPPPPPPVQLSAGFDEFYQARVGDFNSDGLSDIYIALDLSITDLPGVEGFYLVQNSNQSFSLFTSLTPSQHALGEQAPLISSQVELYAEDLDGNTINDLYLRNLSSVISGANDVLVFASDVAGDPPTGYVEADEDFVAFFTQSKRWLSQPAFILNTVIANNGVTLTPNGSPVLADWRVDYLYFVGYGTGSDGLTDYANDTSDFYDPLAELFGCNDPVAYAGFNSFCYFTNGVWWVTRTAQLYTIEIDFSDFNQDVIELIYPDSSLFYESGILRSVLGNGVIPGSPEGTLLENILRGVLGGNPVFAGVLGGAIPWPGTGGSLPDIDVLPASERWTWLSSGIARLFALIGSLVTPGNIYDNWDLYHYANEVKKDDVLGDGGLTPKPPANVLFFTDQIYPTGWFAKECLALPWQPPTGYWVFRQEDEVIAVPSPNDVQGINFDLPPPNGDGLGYGQLQGGGREWTSVQPFIPVTIEKPFIDIPVGIRPSGFTINCSIFGIL